MALVTGASSGIGRALAHELARAGCRLLLTALEGPELTAAVEEVRARWPVPVDAFGTDLTDGAGRRALVAWIRTRPEPLDLFVSNAGGGRFRRFTAAPWEELAATLALNVVAPTHLAREILPLLLERPEAGIVLVSSGIARLPYPGLAVYGASKGYLDSLGETLACELLGTQVRVLVFHPGFTRTGFMAAAQMDMSRVPGFMVSAPEKAARCLVRRIAAGSQWAYSDLPARLGALAGPLVPSRLRVRILRNLFWRLPQ